MEKLIIKAQYVLFDKYENLGKSDDPNDAGNKVVKDPNFLKNVEDYIRKFNCEASYFLEVNGNRTMVLVLDLPSPDMIPAIAEPLFQGFDANVEIHPAMNLDDLKKAISNMPVQKNKETKFSIFSYV